MSHVPHVARSHVALENFSLTPQIHIYMYIYEMTRRDRRKLASTSCVRNGPKAVACTWVRPSSPKSTKMMTKSRRTCVSFLFARGGIEARAPRHRGPRQNELWHSNECVMSRIGKSHVANKIESCHSYERVMSHM